jgi:hypothetical protein
VDGLRIQRDMRLSLPNADRQMVDISLLLDITRQQETVLAWLRERGAPPFLFDRSRVYQEAERRPVGLHVTIFEFLHVSGSDTAIRNSVHVFADTMSRFTRLEGFAKTRFVLEFGACVLGTSDLHLTCRLSPVGRSEALARLLRLCRDGAPHGSREIGWRDEPSHMHCTLWRLPGGLKLSWSERRALVEFLGSPRASSLGTLDCTGLSFVLTLAHLEPFDGISRLQQIAGSAGTSS